MANELPNKDVSGVFGKAAGNDNFPNFNEDIVNYRDPNLDPAVKARMDKLIESINIKDLNTITVFGKEPTDVLRESSENIVRRAQSATGFLSGFDQLKDKLANFDFEGIGKIAADYSKTVKRRMEMAAITWKQPIKKLWYKLTGRKYNTTLDTLRHEIDKSLLQLGDVVADLEKAKDKIPGVISDLNTLETNRLNAYSEYGVYIGAAAEKYRRVKEDDLPKLEQEVTTSPVKQVELRQFRLAATVLNAKLTDMDGFHKSSLVQLKTIDDMQEALAMSQLKIDSHLTISQGQWYALLAEASTAATISTIAEANQAADAFGDKIFEQSQKLSDLTKAMARESFGHGTLDPVKIIQHLEKRTQDIKEDLEFIAQFNQKMEAQRGQLDEAGRKFREAAVKVTQAPAELAAQPASVADDTPARKHPSL